MYGNSLDGPFLHTRVSLNYSEHIKEHTYLTCMFIPNITDRHNSSLQSERLCKTILWTSVTSLSGVCFGMQNMQTFVSACRHLVRALCLHVFKERGRQTQGRQLWLLNQHRQARPGSKVRGHAASWSPIQWHRCHTMSVNSH